jgi:hypothetical protein
LETLAEHCFLSGSKNIKVRLSDKHQQGMLIGQILIGQVLVGQMIIEQMLIGQMLIGQMLIGSKCWLFKC